MKAAIVYVFPNTPDAQRTELAARFVCSYKAHPAEHDHDTIVVLNGSGGAGEGFVGALFASLPNLRIIKHDNSGWDLGAFQFAARSHPCDLMMFFGVSAWFPKAGWMRRAVDATRVRGLAVYGSHGNQGNGVNVWPHVRTTGWWVNPQLLNRYPVIVTDPGQRYPFEHGPTCFCQWAKSQGVLTWVVAWDGEYPIEHCDIIQNGFHRGDQGNLLFRDRLTDPPYYA